jgi:hypothetical protein
VDNVPIAGGFHWCLFYQGSDNAIKQVDYYDKKWHSPTTIIGNAVALTPLAVVNTIPPPGTPDTFATLLLYWKDSGGLLRQTARLWGSELDWPRDYIDTWGWFPGANVAGVPWPPEGGQQGALRLYLPDTSGTMQEIKVTYDNTQLDTHPNSPSYNSSGLSLQSRPLAAVTEISQSGDRVITVYTSSNSGKEIEGFQCQRGVSWTAIDRIQWDNLT